MLFCVIVCFVVVVCLSVVLFVCCFCCPTNNGLPQTNPTRAHMNARMLTCPPALTDVRNVVLNLNVCETAYDQYWGFFSRRMKAKFFNFA